MTDGSVDTQTKIGYGAYLAIFTTDFSLSELNLETSVSKLKNQVKLKRFEQTSSTTLELQTLLWALGEIQTSGRQVKVYTDSQNIIALPGRRSRLEQNNYRSNKNILLKNSALYRQFYQLSEHFDCQFIKIPGHQPTAQKDIIAKLFGLVDKASRKALRKDLSRYA
ncbi:RNase H family protein [uncultured Desulfuromusa sp.]|uniref:ribonuclease HI n=1 Tax=uncultured Desulfuromusa sp. TaxID=219183 RepID=UPI002AA82762|nr:RNase H family protein [uncultured Desulfuromusa sp.]